jgi:hypothetical protein
LNPIAALRAAIMAKSIHPSRESESGCCRAASNAPASANGNAKTEWLKRTNPA